MNLSRSINPTSSPTAHKTAHNLHNISLEIAAMALSSCFSIFKIRVKTCSLTLPKFGQIALDDFTTSPTYGYAHNKTAMRNMTNHLPSHGFSALLLRDACPEPQFDTLQLPCCAIHWQCTWPNGSYYSN